ncbi:MAG: hypothetical protein P1U57_04365, partial [Oleibacter sp.]|nr:hypothetical protein [Thalassolituus sp.]
MNTSANAVSLTSRIIRKTWWLALVPAIYALYLGFVSIVLLLGQNTIVTLEDDPFLDLSLAMAPNNAEANAAKAGFIRRRALLPDNPDPKGDLQIALDHWLKAIEGRPLWPYYQLGALDSEYL